MSQDINQNLSIGKCECCGIDGKTIVGVASIPYMPISIAWCGDCLVAGVIPVWAAVSNTALCGGLEHCNDSWKYLVYQTLAYFSRTIEDFNQMVKLQMEEE